MGLFKRAKSALGGVDDDLIATGLLARGNVQSVEMGSVSTGVPERGLGTEVVCLVTVEVIGLDGQDPYVASCHHPIPQVYLPKLNEPGAAVAVRVDPRDPQRIALDLTHDVPAAPTILVSDDGTRETLKTHQGTFTYEDLIRDGRPCTVDVLAVFPLDQLTRAGLPATAVVLQVSRDGVPPYQAQVGLHVPDAAVSVVVPGARLPGKWLPGPGLPTDVNLVTIDFPALQA
jgi:hypothetical protein